MAGSGGTWAVRGIVVRKRGVMINEELVMSNGRWREGRGAGRQLLMSDE
jgi:hypothetical protein